MAVRSEKLFAGAMPVGGAVSVYSVPVGKTTIVKSIYVFNTTAVAATIACDVGQDGVRPVIFFQTLGGLAALRLDTWFVIDEGDTIALSISAGTGTAIISGAELLGVST